MFGYYPGTNNLLNHTFFNWINASNPLHPEGRILATPTAPYVNDCDPDHSLPGTTYKLFGYAEAKSGNLTFPAPMASFVEEERYLGFLNKTEYCNVMQGFPPERVPILSTLASEFVLFDDFFASVPGPTWPNRLFFFAASSGGLTETGAWYHNESGTLFPMPTIYDQVTQVGGTWKHYYNDTPWELFLQTVATHPENVVSMDAFFEDAQRGTLPDFSFINPRCGVNVSSGEGANDQHPDHDVALGERFVKDVYEALRASPAWNDTLFIVTYDEHGGFFDHVPPPMAGVPNPSPDLPSYPDAGFQFDRLGVRIPLLLISPWVGKGLVQGPPPAAQQPTPTSQYELTSIAASVRKILKVFVEHNASAVAPLTARDAWAATFEHLIEASPRTDCPMHLPPAPLPTQSLHAEGQLEVNGLQRDIAAAHLHSLRHAAGHVRDAPPMPSTQAELGTWLQEVHQAQRRHRFARRQQLSSSSFSLPVVPVLATPPFDNSIVQSYWTLQNTMTGGAEGGNEGERVVRIQSYLDATAQWICLAYGGSSSTDGTPPLSSSSSSSFVQVVPCNHSIVHDEPVDVTQQWIVGFADEYSSVEGSLSIRPLLEPDRCLTGHSLSATSSSSSNRSAAGAETEPLSQTNTEEDRALVVVVPTAVTVEKCESRRNSGEDAALRRLQQRWATGGTAGGIGPVPNWWGGVLVSVGPFLLALQQHQQQQ